MGEHIFQLTNAVGKQRRNFTVYSTCNIGFVYFTPIANFHLFQGADAAHAHTPRTAPRAPLSTAAPAARSSSAPSRSSELRPRFRRAPFGPSRTRAAAREDAARAAAAGRGGGAHPRRREELPEVPLPGRGAPPGGPGPAARRAVP